MENQAAHEGGLARTDHPYSEMSKFDGPLDYKHVLDSCIKPTLKIVYDQLMENLSDPDEVVDPVMVIDLLATFRCSLLLWEQIDKNALNNKEG